VDLVLDALREEVLEVIGVEIVRADPQEKEESPSKALFP